jgi:TatD DNase family protein
MIDTHAHLDFPQYDDDRDAVIRSDFNNGLEAIINIGTDLESSRKSIQLAERYEHIYAAAGIHPHDTNNRPPDYIAALRTMAGHKKTVAIGEIGLDYYRDLSPRNIQRETFEKQLKLAAELNLPVVVHIREALDDSLEILRKSGIKKGVLHSFPGNESEASAAIERGFFISFAGPITYPKSSRPGVAASLPLSRIVAETDSPYLTPQALRGKRNRPGNVRYVIEELARIFTPFTFDDIERITSFNARRLFDLPMDKTARIAYKIRRSLYLNLTNRCSNNCYFCRRTAPPLGYVAGHYLLLNSEPDVPGVLEAVDSESDFDEVVFCGLGEPTVRLKKLLEIARQLKAKGYSVRLNTNGQGNLINKTDVPSKLAGVIDRVRVALNAHDAETYVRICRPDFGRKAYGAVLDFVLGCRNAGIPVTVSVVDLPEVDIDACRKLASEMGAEFHLRAYSNETIEGNGK